ncbi:MAG: hypothetical protein ACJ736_16550 [Streptomyces sp.]|jgi:hypothetical protein
MSDQSRTAAATAAVQRYAAERHASDPVKLGKAVRTVQAALESRALDLAELVPSAPAEVRSCDRGRP